VRLEQQPLPAVIKVNLFQSKAFSKDLPMNKFKNRICLNPSRITPLLSLSLAALALIVIQASSVQAQWTTNGNDISNSNSGNVGIRTASPAFPLQVNTATGGQVESGTLGGAFGTFAIVSQNNTHGLYFGVGSSGKAWLQVTRQDGNPQPYDFSLQAAGGNVGIGTISPSEKLEVAGNAKITGNLTTVGTITGGVINAKYQDIAEWVPASGQMPSGTVVVLDAAKSNHVISSTRSYDTHVAGVVSPQPGIALGERGENKVLVATTGRVKLRVDASKGPIEIGDLLVTSDIPGLAMKSEGIRLGDIQIHRPGTLIGKALEPLAKGQGEILVLLSLQ
jgi:hypothetical protein